MCSINSTFLTLILKCEKPNIFAYFHPISLCNLIYKLISKFISNGLKPFLSKVLTIGQFGFLKNRQILELVGIPQEILHTIKIQKLEAMVLKLDLIKDFDRVNWNFLRLILSQVGLSLNIVNWIMGCVSSANFSVLVKGSPSGFFNASRGLRQGCSLSPLLFILVIEGLSILIGEAKRNDKIQGIRLSPNLAITNVIFVDDVVLFGIKNIRGMGCI